MIVASQGYIFIQEFGDAVKPDIVAGTVREAGYEHHDHMFSLAQLVDGSADAREEYLSLWENAYRAQGVSLVTSYAGLANHERFVQRHERSVREAIHSIVRHFPTLRILTTNPDPLPDSRAKTDSMLQAEIEDLSVFGSIAAEHGLSLSLHFHTPELQNESRELRAIMDAVDPELLKLTFDVNWCLRGGESISDMLDRYQQRVNVTHLRSSRDGVWEEVLSDGDEVISLVLERLWADPIERVHVIELADEPQMTITKNLVERLQSSRERLDRWREQYEARVPTNSP